RNSHCGWCGALFAVATWPRACVCGNTSYANPIPVAVVLLPVGDGLLTIRRGIPPQLGKLALPGGFMELGETWQESAARELREETGIVVAPAGFTVFDVASTGHG